MKLPSFKTIRTRLTTWFLILALAPLFVGILISYYQQKQSLEEETFRKLTAIRDLKVQQVENWINERMGDLNVMARDLDMRSLENIFDKTNKSSDDLDKIELARAVLKRFQVNYNSYEEIFIIGTNTKLIEISSNDNSIGENETNNSFFTVPLETGKIYIKDIYYSETLGKPQMTISMPIFCLEHGNHIIGILVARINLENSLYKLLLNKVGLGETGETLIVNKDVIALNELHSYKNATLELKINAKPAVEAAQGETGITKTLDYNGVEVLAAYTYIAQTEWGFICKQDLFELNEPIRTLVLNLLLLVLISAFVIIILVFWISKKISKPIVDLNTTTKKIKSGDYSVRNNINSQDELGSLAQSINEMTASIESHITTQKGVADIAETMIEQTGMKEFGKELLKQLMEITAANMSVFYILNELNSAYEPYTSIGVNSKGLRPFSAENPEGEIGNAVSTKKIHYLHNIPENTIFSYKTTAGDAIPKEIVTIPILIDNTVVGLISLVNISPFKKESLEILKQSWTGINTAYSNLMSNKRTRILAESLSYSNQQLEAQKEELQEQAEELQGQTEEIQRTSEELQEQNIELQAQRNEVEEANKLKTEFLSNMSHELRTPLNSIMALSRVLIMQTQEKLDNEENNYLKIIERNGKRLLNLINDILDLSKIEAGKTEVSTKQISIKALLHLIRENVLSLAEEKALNINIDTPDDLPKIESDESKLHQILLNIIGNAVKFTENGSIDISVKHNADYIFIDVKDSGIGISKKDLPSIFNEFKQADGTTSRRYQGTGLGLAIANKLINIIGGSIKVKSKLKEGSTFTVSIPINWDKNIFSTEQTKLIQEEKIPRNINYSKEISANKRILIVEDNLDAIVQVKAVLEKEGYQIDVANGGQEALDYIQHTIPNGIILDLMMPNIDGFEVLERLRSTPKAKTIPVLILTAKDLTLKDLEKLSSNNVQQLIHKGDVDINGLLDKVRLMLGNESLIPKPQASDLKKEENLPFEISTSVKIQKSGLPNVLVVEDNPDNMTTIKAILKGNYSIREAIDGESGLKMIQTHLPDIILLDMSLPKMNGKRIVRNLKEDNKTKDIPVIAVTAQAMKGDKEKFIQAGCDGYVSKPINPILLIEEIRKLLNND